MGRALCGFADGSAASPKKKIRTELFPGSNPRYNRSALRNHTYRRAGVLILTMLCAFFAASCTAPFGPGYSIDKQEVRVQFHAAPEPQISVEAEYELRNTGTKPLTLLEFRLPGRRRFHSSEMDFTWDGKAVALGTSEENPRNAVLNFPEAWAVSGRHTLRVKMNFENPKGDESSYMAFAPDAFFLPAQGWQVQLLPARGIFATGGVPPTKWNLTVEVPEGFAVHASGDKIKKSRKGGEIIVRARQRPTDEYPFVIAGRYVSTQVGSGSEKIYLWTRQAQDSAGLREAGASVDATVREYDAVFGKRGKEEKPLWFVECPVVPGCFTKLASRSGILARDDPEEKSSEMVSLDSVVFDLKGGLRKLGAVAAPSLASSWLGYAQSPGFFEQDAPLGAFPAFAAAVGREASSGAGAREETIRNALRVIPAGSVAQTENDDILRAKSFLFFYGLQDRYGAEVFRKAVQHMLYARRSGGFNLDDLIASFGAESHQNVAEFVRLWMKHPGVPREFRARYEKLPAGEPVSLKERSE